jgi:hypothetical protein
VLLRRRVERLAGVVCRQSCRAAQERKRFMRHFRSRKRLRSGALRRALVHWNDLRALSARWSRRLPRQSLHCAIVFSEGQHCQSWLVAATPEFESLVASSAEQRRVQRCRAERLATGLFDHPEDNLGSVTHLVAGARQERT